MEQLKKLENKLAVAVSIIKFDTIHYQYTSIDTAQLIQQFKLWGLTDREILSKFKISKKEYSHCQKAFEDYFFNRIRG